MITYIIDKTIYKEEDNEIKEIATEEELLDFIESLKNVIRKMKKEGDLSSSKAKKLYEKADELKDIAKDKAEESAESADISREEAKELLYMIGEEISLQKEAQRQIDKDGRKLDDFENRVINIYKEYGVTSALADIMAKTSCETSQARSYLELLLAKAEIANPEDQTKSWSEILEMA